MVVVVLEKYPMVFHSVVLVGIIVALANIVSDSNVIRNANNRDEETKFFPISFLLIVLINLFFLDEGLSTPVNILAVVVTLSNNSVIGIF